MQNDRHGDKMTEISFNGGFAKGMVAAPPSKSYTHRAIIMSALANGESVIHNGLPCDDTSRTIEAMAKMGSLIEQRDNDLIIRRTMELHPSESTIDVFNSGTTMRLVTGISALFDKTIEITGDSSIRKRPMKPLLDALERCGVECTSNDGKAPITIKGPIKTNSITIDGSISSQFISSLLMMSPLIGRPFDIIIEGKRISKPYVEITISMMKEYGIIVEETPNGYHVKPQEYKPCEFTVPGDFSSAAFPLVAGGLSGCVSVSGLNMDDPQGDKKIIDILKKSGCEVIACNDTVTCTCKGRPKAIDVDLSDMPDLFPIVAVLLSTAEGTSRLYGAPQLRFKESDRIESTVAMLKTLGANIEGTDDGCIIEGVEKLTGGCIDHKSDHRLMMSAAVASLVANGPVTMKKDNCWCISYPDFLEQMQSVGLRWNDVLGRQ